MSTIPIKAGMIGIEPMITEHQGLTPLKKLSFLFPSVRVDTNKMATIGVSALPLSYRPVVLDQDGFEPPTSLSTSDNQLPSGSCQNSVETNKLANIGLFQCMITEILWLVPGSNKLSAAMD